MNEQIAEIIDRQKPVGFDVAASVFSLRSDLRRFGTLTNETLNKVLHEELSFVAEVLDAYHDKTYCLSVRGGEVYALDEQTTLGSILQNGLQAAKQQYEQDPRAEFWYRRQNIFVEEYQRLQQFLAEANSDDVYISFSPYPEEAAARYGASYIEQFGPSAKRRQAFTYIYRKNEDGSLSQQVLTFDKSDTKLLKEISASLGVVIEDSVTSDELQAYPIITTISDNHNLADALRTQYDVLQQKYHGIKTFGGRADLDTTEAWQFIESNQDLINGYMANLEQLAKQQITNEKLVQAKTMLTYSFWAAFKERLELTRTSGQHHIQSVPKTINAEMGWALNRAVTRGDTFNACGGSITLESLATMQSTNVAAIIFGQSPELWQWRKGFCRVGNCPTKPQATKIGPCNVCVGCQKHFDSGKDPAKIYEQRKFGSHVPQQKPNEIIDSLRFWFGSFYE